MSLVILRRRNRRLRCISQAVDVVGQAGKPRTISGFQTHQTPVRLGQSERAELGSEEFISYSHVLEGYVVLAKNAGFEKEADLSSAAGKKGKGKLEGVKEKDEMDLA